MKIGDKVRFLSEIGGGVIVGFQNNTVALVEDEDGFQIPTQVCDLVVVNDDRQAKCVPGMVPQESDNKSAQQEAIEHNCIHHSENLLDKIADNVNISVIERPSCDKICFFVGFVPQDRHNINKTRYSLYVINDCNYFLSYTYSLFDGTEWKMLSHNDLEPNTKLLIADVNIADIDNFRNGAIQINAYKVGKSFTLQPTLDVRLKIDAVKFYKLHSFRENEFFDENAMIIPVVLDGKPVRELAIDTAELKEKMTEKKKADITSPARKTLSKADKKSNEPLVIDLHASELLDTTVGLSHSDILNYQLEMFRKTLDEFKSKKGMKIIFIHGKGEGVLRNALIHELKYRYKSFTYQDASFQEYGYGATQITIH